MWLDVVSSDKVRPTVALATAGAVANSCSCGHLACWQDTKSYLLMMDKYKRCPRCSQFIDKNMGCMHMTCRPSAGGCGFEVSLHSSGTRLLCYVCKFDDGVCAPLVVAPTPLLPQFCWKCGQDYRAHNQALCRQTPKTAREWNAGRADVVEGGRVLTYARKVEEVDGIMVRFTSVAFPFVLLYDLSRVPCLRCFHDRPNYRPRWQQRALRQKAC